MSNSHDQCHWPFFPPSLQLSSFLPLFNRAGKKGRNEGKAGRGRAVPHHSASFCSYSSLRSRLLLSCRVSPARPYIAMSRPPAGTLREQAEKSPVTQGTHSSTKLLPSAKGARRGQMLHQGRVTFPKTHITPQTKVLLLYCHPPTTASLQL